MAKGGGEALKSFDAFAAEPAEEDGAVALQRLVDDVAQGVEFGGQVDPGLAGLDAQGEAGLKAQAVGRKHAHVHGLYAPVRGGGFRPWPCAG
jgi:hypothetical protein